MCYILPVKEYLQVLTFTREDGEKQLIMGSQWKCKLAGSCLVLRDMCDFVKDRAWKNASWTVDYTTSPIDKTSP